MYILCPRIQKDTFRRRKCPSSQIGEPLRGSSVRNSHTGRLRQLRRYFSIKINFSNVFFVFFASEGGARRAADWGPGVWGSSSKKAPLLSFVSVWENRIRNRLATVPVCDDGHFLHRKVSFFGSGCSRSTGEGATKWGFRGLAHLEILGSRCVVTRNPP